MFTEFLIANKQEIIARTRTKIAGRSTPPPTEDELQNGVPLFLSQLVDRLSQTTLDSGAIEESAAKHGRDLQRMGFTVGQVVHDYGDICQAVTELCVETNAPITTDEFHTLNRCLDDAIAEAVTEYSRQRDRSITHERTARLGTFNHELRNRLTGAMLSFNILKKGNVALGGSTGAVLGRSLRELRDLVNQSLAELRLESGEQQRQRVSVIEILGDVEIEAYADAMARGLHLVVAPGERGVDVDVDPQILTAAVSNLLQSAFEHSRRSNHVALRATATRERVLIEIEDELGGIPPDQGEDRSRQLEPRATDRASLALDVCRKGVAAMGGELRGRDLPGRGRIFTIELARLAPP